MWPRIATRPGSCRAAPRDAVNTDSVHNEGGAVITTSTLQLVFWGEQWTSVSGPSAADVVDAVNRILRSAYLFEMRQYGFEELPVRGSTIGAPTSSSSCP